MKCQKCGARLEEGVLFCRECGAKVEAPKKKSKKTLIIAAAVILLLAVVGSRGGKSLSSRDTGVRDAESYTSSERKIAVINVVDMTYPEAANALLSTGFTNITTNVDSNTDESQWVVIKQSVNAGKFIRPGDKIELTCALKCKLYIDVHSEANLMFSTYDITVSLDGTEIGSISNGKGFTYLADILSGDHSLVFCKAGSSSPKCTKKITVTGDMTYSCDLGHSGSSIDIKNEKTDSSISGATLEVVDVTGMVLSEAMAKLSEIGFSNVREEPYGSIWDKDNWIVTAQGIVEGTVADKNDFIQLDCISLDDYFSNTYVGKNVSEIQELAAASGFSIRFENDSWDDMNDEIAAMDQETKSDWLATKARQYGGADKTAVVTIKYTGEVAATPKPTPAPTPIPTPTPSPTLKPSVSYSSNDKDTAKKGNSGVFSYRDMGGSYYVYYIIDFDEGYVYFFCEGNGDTTCERVKMVSGNLNDVLIITYHDGSDTWSYGIHFKWKNQPDHLIVQDEDGFEWDFYTTDLDDALALLAKKSIYDY